MKLKIKISGKLIFTILCALIISEVEIIGSDFVCLVTPPTNLSESNLTATFVRLNWTPGTNGLKQLLRVGTDLNAVKSGCPNGTGPQTGCIIKEDNLSTSQNSYSINSGLTPNTIYYWRVVTFASSNCYTDAFKDFSTLSSNYPDHIAPSVSIVEPVNGATVTGTINVTAKASDNVGVKKVEFYVDNVLRNTDTITPYSFSLDTTQLSEGLHTIMVKAYDMAGNMSTTSVVIRVLMLNRIDTVITSTGGILNISNATVFIPPFAVSSPTAIIVGDEKIDNDASITEREIAAKRLGYTSLSSGIVLLPFGMKLNKPISITIRLTRSPLHVSAVNNIFACIWDPQLKAWNPIPSKIDTDKNIITAETDLFSVVKVFSSPSNVSAIGEVYVFPNPVKNNVKPVFHIESGPAKVEIAIYDLTHRLIHKKVLTDEPSIINRNNKLSYAYEYTWDITDVSSGVYFYIITIDTGSTKTIKKGKFAIIK